MKVFKVLTFTIVSLLVLVFGTAYICRVNIFKDTNRYYFYITDINNITEDSPIIINGKKIGNIVSIKFDYDTFRSKVIFEIDGRIRLLDHSVVNINGLDFSNKTLEIQVNDGDIIKKGSEVNVVDKSVKTADVIKKVNKILDNVSEISTNLVSITKHVNTEVVKIKDENLVGRVAEIVNQVTDLVNRGSDLVNNVKIPWLFRK